VSRKPDATWWSLWTVAVLAVQAFLPAALAETEPNNSFTEATLIDSDAASIPGSLSQSDNADMYKILLNRTPPYVEAVTAQLTRTSPEGQVRLYLYDEDGYRLAWNATVSGAPVSSSVCAPYTGHVYIVVLLWLGAQTADYELNVTRANLTPDPALLDGNNRPSGAKAAYNGFSVVKDLDSFYNAGDFYYVQAAAGQSFSDILTVHVTVPATADIMVELFREANSTPIALSDGGDIFNPDPGVNETIYYVCRETGRLELRIWAERGGGTYVLNISLFRGWLDSDNDPDNATALTQDGPARGNVSLNWDQDDYYSMDLPSDTTIDLKLTTSGFDNESRLPNLNLYLMDPSRSYVNISTGLDPAEQVTFVAREAGHHYIRVGAGRDSAGNYTLEVATVRPPVVLVPAVQLSVDEDGSTVLDLLSVFQDPQGRALQFGSETAENLNLSIEVQPPSGALLQITPRPDWNGRVLFGINATNPEGKVARSTVNLTVRPVNDPPVAEHSSLNFSTVADRPYTLDVSVFSLFSDIDGDALEYAVLDIGPLAVVIDPADGRVTATPPLYWSGVVTFRIIASDPTGASAEVRVTLIVSPVNHAPLVVVQPGNITFAEHGNATVDLGAAFWDPDGDPMALGALDNIMLSVGIAGGLARVEAHDPHWSGNESVTFFARDPSNATAYLVINFTVTEVNDPPYIFRVLQNQSIREDAPTALFNLNGYFRDPDEGQRLSFNVTAPDGNVSISISQDGWVTFTPAANWSGRVSMMFSARDPLGESAEQAFNLTVEPQDDPPVLSGAAVSPRKGDTATVFTFTVVVTDQDSPSVTVLLKVGRRSIVMERLSGDLASGATYRVRTALPGGDNAFFIQADDGERLASTDSVELYVGQSSPDNTNLYIILIALTVIIVALALVFTPSRSDRDRKDEEE